MTMKIEKSRWGRDHLSMLFWVCHCFTNKPHKEGLLGKKGVPLDHRYSRINENNYPQFKYFGVDPTSPTNAWKSTHSTKDNEGNQIEGHCEGAILDELEEEGYIENVNTGLNPLYSLPKSTLKIWGHYQALGGDNLQRKVKATPLAKVVFSNGDLSEVEKEVA